MRVRTRQLMLTSPHHGRPQTPVLPHISRALFLKRSSLGILAALAANIRAMGSQPPASPATAYSWKGRGNSKVKRWDVITIGNLSRNRYWGESDAKGVRSAICTCTMVQGEGFCLLVDPSLSSVEQMAKELDRRTGLKPGDVTAVFVTHEHADHWAGLGCFPKAQWLAAPQVADALNRTGKGLKKVEATASRLFKAVDIVPTPGHTLSHHSLRFDCQGFSVVLAGDVVATQDFWHDRRGYYNCVDFDLSAKTMDRLASLADLVVPGHDNYFLSVAT